MLRPAAALLLALPLLAAGPAAAAGMVCVRHEAGFVARVTLEQQQGDGRWVQRVQRNATSGSTDCLRDDEAVRVTVEGHTGFGWRATCTEVFNRGQSGVVTIKGTSLHQRCERF